MMLGVVLHTALSYMPDAPWAFTDPWAHAELRTFLDAIHLFRMPAFFAIAGFFGALLWYQRGAREMLRNRFQRLFLPLVVFSTLLWALGEPIGALAQAILDGEATAWAGVARLDPWSLFPPRSPMHLWFLHCLVIISALVALAVTFMERRAITWPRLLPALRRTVESPVRCVLLLGLMGHIYCALVLMDNPPASGWWPPPSVIVYYLGCYAVGWMIFTSKVDLETLRERTWTLLAVGCLCVALRSFAHEATKGMEHGPVDLLNVWELPPALFWWGGVRVLAFTYGMVALARGVTGLFLRFASSGAPGWRYLSDASYWVYLLHLPLAVFIPALLVSWRAPGLLKFCVATALVAVVCLATYDALVRATFVGHFLNGRRYPRRLPWLSAAVSVLALGSMAYGAIRVIDPADRAGPWVGGFEPPATVGTDAVERPFRQAKPPHPALERCVQVGGYGVCPDRVPFDDAVAACAAWGAGPVVFEDPAENVAVGKLVRALMRRPFWIPINDQAEEGAWRWNGGSPVEHSAWSPGEPNDHGDGEDCAASNWVKEARWNDIVCKARLAFVCEGP